MSDETTFYPPSSLAWRQWLKENHKSAPHVWLIYYKAHTDTPTISWSEAVDEALCFGWVDSQKKTIDEDRYMQYFSPRKPKSMWSQINKEKVEKLIAEGRMTDAGQKSIDIAKKNGSWSILDDVHNLIVPSDLDHAFSQHPGSREYYDSLSDSRKKGILAWIILAKRTQTRANRIQKVVEAASRSEWPQGLQ